MGGERQKLRELSCVVLTEGIVNMTGAPATVLPLVEGHKQRPRRHSSLDRHVGRVGERRENGIFVNRRTMNIQSRLFLCLLQAKKRMVMMMMMEYW